MDSADLFSFLDEVPPDADEEQGASEDDNAMVADAPQNPSARLVKRKASDPVISSRPENVDAVMQEPGDDPGPSAPKKTRTGSPNPVILDDFETEAKREVAASAGLTGGVEAGSRLELRHQVCPPAVPFPCVGTDPGP